MCVFVCTGEVDHSDQPGLIVLQFYRIWMEHLGAVLSSLTRERGTQRSRVKRHRFEVRCRLVITATSTHAFCGSSVGED